MGPIRQGRDGHEFPGRPHSDRFVLRVGRIPGNGQRDEPALYKRDEDRCDDRTDETLVGRITEVGQVLGGLLRDPRRPLQIGEVDGHDEGTHDLERVRQVETQGLSKLERLSEVDQLRDYVDD